MKSVGSSAAIWSDAAEVGDLHGCVALEVACAGVARRDRPGCRPIWAGIRIWAGIVSESETIPAQNPIPGLRFARRLRTRVPAALCGCGARFRTRCAVCLSSDVVDLRHRSRGRPPMSGHKSGRCSPHSTRATASPRSSRSARSHQRDARARCRAPPAHRLGAGSAPGTRRRRSRPVRAARQGPTPGDGARRRRGT